PASLTQPHSSLPMLDSQGSGQGSSWSRPAGRTRCGFAGLCPSSLGSPRGLLHARVGWELDLHTGISPHLAHHGTDGDSCLPTPLETSALWAAIGDPGKWAAQGCLPGPGRKGTKGRGCSLQTPWFLGQWP
ncbi:Hypothetical predicted protein, partial [Marmota monax]